MPHLIIVLALGAMPSGRVARRALASPRMGLLDGLFSLPEREGCNYQNLIGRPNSWGKQASLNALAGVIPTVSDDGYAVATFAGGCFWGIELAFQRVPGVICTSVGYCQGSLERPTYQEVCGARTGHTEAVQLLYDPKEVSYEQLCAVLMGRLGRSMFLVNQVGNDRGPQYRHGIYTHTSEQAKVAADVLAKLQAQVGGNKIVTEIEPVAVYWPAEELHQQYLAKGGRFSTAQSAAKGCTTEIRCYG